MQTDLDWGDLALFAAVARAGSLAGAAAETGASPATLSRRMTALERRLGRRLFLHGAGGYTVTPDGRDLAERVRAMEAASVDIGRWQEAAKGPARVRISAGTWTARLLARNLARYWQPTDPWMPEFVYCNLDMDIARREIDIGIRNRRPEQPWLAGRRTGEVHHAVYATSEDVTGWIGANFETARLPSERWVADHHGGEITTTANDPLLRLDLAEAGLGRVVLPTFIGDTRPALTRLSPVIDDLTAEEWLVAHHEARHEPAIRAALDAFAGFLSAPDRARAA
ncbi:LysR family transcriptional regulator [Aestuariibius sp. 2305UL40-4]|uniref:LysR family transcriptional regulator n=1 Tax=Aestuariibius violaceus TaxID=3234132 RepID=UPI00345ECC6A